MFKREYYIIVFLHKLVKRQSFLSTFRLTTKSSSPTVTKSCRWMLYVRTDHQPRIKDSLQKENPILIGKELGITN